MSDSINLPQSSSGAEDTESKQGAETRSGKKSGLRWWPALVLVLGMIALKMIPMLLDSPTLPVMMLSFMGPAGLGALLLVWWCFASRASIKEKLLGIIAVLVIATVSIGLLHFSLKGMFTVVLVVPTGLAAYAFGLIVMSGNPNKRLPIALLMTSVVFGYWNLLQNEGTTGNFQSQLSWRWQPNAEQRYLEELANREKHELPPADPSSPGVTSGPPAWPSFRGADRDGVVRGVALASDWKTSPPKLIWKQKIGPGWSSFTVSGERIYTQEQRGESEAVICLDGNTGQMIWDFTYPSRFWEAIAGAGPRATPTISNEGIYALGAEGILVRLDARTGAELWRRDLKVDADRQPPTWGFASSPLVTNSLVIVHAGGTGDKGLFAYSAETGDIAWSIPTGNHSYSSAQLATFSDHQGLLMLCNDGLQFIQAADGKVIWRHDWKLENYRVLQPMVVDQSVFFTTSIQEGTMRLNISCGDDTAWSVEDAWTTQNLKSDYNDAVFHEGYIYGFDGGVFSCVDAADGSRKWKRGRYGNGQVIVLPDANQLLVISETGELVLLEASPDQLTELTRFQAIEGKTWNHPVLIGERLYVRNSKEVACFELATIEVIQEL